jgi:hypothetical protein
MTKQTKARCDKLVGLGCKFDGSTFTYKNIFYNWTEISCLTNEQFDKVVETFMKRMNAKALKECSDWMKKYKKESKGRAPSVADIWHAAINSKVVCPKCNSTNVWLWPNRADKLANCIDCKHVWSSTTI